MTDKPLPWSLCVLILLLANAVLWMALFRLGQAARYFLFG